MERMNSMDEANVLCLNQNGTGQWNGIGAWKMPAQMMLPALQGRKMKVEYILMFFAAVSFFSFLIWISDWSEQSNRFKKSENVFVIA